MNEERAKYLRTIQEEFDRRVTEQAGKEFESHEFHPGSEDELPWHSVVFKDGSKQGYPEAYDRYLMAARSWASFCEDYIKAPPILGEGEEPDLSHVDRINNPHYMADMDAQFNVLNNLRQMTPMIFYHRDEVPTFEEMGIDLEKWLEDE